MVKLLNMSNERKIIKSAEMQTGHVYRVLSNEKNSLPDPGSILFIILDRYLRYSSLFDKTEHGWGEIDGGFEVEEIDIEIKDLGACWENKRKV